jgi:hypothetical protein
MYIDCKSADLKSQRNTYGLWDLNIVGYYYSINNQDNSFELFCSIEMV